MQKYDDFKGQKQIKENQISQTNKDQTFSKQAQLGVSAGSKSNTSNISGDEDKNNILLVIDERYSTNIRQYLTTNYSLENLADLIKQIGDDSNILNQHHGMIGIRKILSLTGYPFIQTVIDSRLVPKMINYIKQQEYPQLQLQAAWALANVASGTTQQCQPIIDNGGIPLFVDLLQSNNIFIAKHAIRAIVNISMSGARFRDGIIKAGGLVILVQLNDKLIDKTLIMLCIRAISNLCLGSPIPKYEAVQLALPILCLAIATGEITDKQILSDCFWAIFYQSEKNDTILIVVENGVIPQLIKNMKQNDLDLVLPCIRIVGNLSAAGTIEHVDQLLENGLLQSLEYLLDNPNRVVRSDVCWVVSNITAGNKFQVQAMLERGQMLKTLLRLFETDEIDVRKWICSIFSNMAQLGDPQQIFSFYKTTNIVRNYVNILPSNDRRFVQTALECLSVILGHGQKFRDNGNNIFVMEVRSIYAVDILEKLQYHKSKTIYQKARELLQTYFQAEEL